MSGPDWVGLLQRTAALGVVILIAAYALSRASTALRARLAPDSDAFYDRRKGRLLSGRARPDEVREARERALLAFARLVAFERGGARAVPGPKERDFTGLVLGHLPLNGVLQAIERKVRALEEDRLERARIGMEAGVALSSLGPLRARDLVREVIMDRSPELVDPFAPAPGGPAPRR